MGRRIKRVRDEAQARPSTRTEATPANSPVVSFTDELVAVLEPMGLRPDDLKRGGVLNPFAPEDGNGFRPFEPGEFVWPHAALRGVEHRTEVERYLWPHRKFFCYVPRGIAA